MIDFVSSCILILHGVLDFDVKIRGVETENIQLLSHKSSLNKNPLTAKFCFCRGMVIVVTKIYPSVFFTLPLPVRRHSCGHLAGRADTQTWK
jgi:hypothetical protein